MLKILDMIIYSSFSYTVCAINFIKPWNPGSYATVPVGAITSHIYLPDSTQKVNTRKFTEWNTVHTENKQVIQNHIEKIYYKTLSNRYTVYTNVSAIDIMAHLKTEHRELNKFDYAVNNAGIKAPITEKTALEELVAHIKDNMKVVFIQDPYTNRQVFQIVVNIISITGLCIERTKKWDKKITAEKRGLTLNSIIPQHSVKSEKIASPPINCNTEWQQKIWQPRTLSALIKCSKTHTLPSQI